MARFVSQATPEMVIPALFVLLAVFSVYAAWKIPAGPQRLKDLLVHAISDPGEYRNPYAAEISRKLGKLGVPVSYRTFLIANGVLCAVFILISVVVLNNILLALVLPGLWMLFAHQLVERVYRIKIKNVLDRQIQTMLQLLAEVYQVSGNLKGAFENVVLITPEPLKQEIENLIVRLNMNGDIDECLLQFANNLNNKDLNTFVHGIVLSRQYGNDIEGIIEMSSAVMRERGELQEELKNETKGKSAIIYIFMLALPAVFIYMFLHSASTRAIFTSTTKGQLLVVAMTIVEFICWHFDSKRNVVDAL